jgi:hypothetical protein
LFLSEKPPPDAIVAGADRTRSSKKAAQVFDWKGLFARPTGVSLFTPIQENAAN